MKHNRMNACRIALVALIGIVDLAAADNSPFAGTYVGSSIGTAQTPNGEFGEAGEFTVTVSAGGTLSATGTITRNINGDPVGSVGFTATGTVTDTGSANLSGTAGSGQAACPFTFTGSFSLVGPDDKVGGGVYDSNCGGGVTSHGEWSCETLFDGPVQRQFTWAGPPGGTYSEPTNWKPEENAPPTHDGQNGDIATFDLLPVDDGEPLTTYAVSAVGATAERFIIDGINLKLIGTAKVFEPSSLSPSLTLIRGGRLTLENGVRLSGVHASVGFNPKLQGALAGLEISGGTSDCLLTGRLIIGEFSDGELFLADGATLSCDQAIIGDGAIGTGNIRGPDSLLDTNSLTLGATSAEGTLQVLESGRVEVVNQIVIGERSKGTLEMIGRGRVDAGEVVLGKETGGDGAIELSGEPSVESSTLSVAGALRVGVAGDGLLRIIGGASANAEELHFAPIDLGTAQESRLFVSGKDSDGLPSSLFVFKPCKLGSGLLQVLEAAQATFANLSLGAGGTTDVTVAGAGDSGNPARLVTSQLTVGLDNFATMKVNTGGDVTCSELAVNSFQTGGIGRIFVTGGNIKVNGTMRVSGDLETGDNVIIETDGVIVANALHLGGESTSESAEIVVRNGTPEAGSSLVILNGVFDSNGECSIGKDGPGVLRLENRGNAVSTGTTRVGGSPTGGAGFVEIGAECRFVAHDLEVGGASPGTITLLTATSELLVTGNAIVNNGGRIEGIGTFTGTRIKNPGGFISPALSPGTLTIKGDYEQGEDGTLIIEVAGLEPGQFDVLKVTGDATLAGTVDLRFIDGFVPQPGDSVDFLQVDGQTTGNLTVNSIVDVPGDSDPDQPIARASVLVETSPEGDLRLRVTSVQALEASGNATQQCGAGACGPGAVPMLPLVAAGLLAMRPLSRRRGGCQRSDG